MGTHSDKGEQGFDERDVRVAGNILYTPLDKFSGGETLRASGLEGGAMGDVGSEHVRTKNKQVQLCVLVLGGGWPGETCCHGCVFFVSFCFFPWECVCFVLSCLVLSCLASFFFFFLSTAGLLVWCSQRVYEGGCFATALCPSKRVK